MTAVKVPTPQFASPVADGAGVIGRSWRDWILAVHKRIGASTDKIDQALSLAQSGAAQTRVITAGAGLDGGGDLSEDRAIRLYIAFTTVAALPSTAQAGQWAFAGDGCKPGESSGSGTGCAVIWTNAGWYSVFSGSVVAA